MKKSLEQQTKLQFPKPLPNMPKWWRDLCPVKEPDKNKHPDTKTDKKVYTIPF